MTDESAQAEVDASRPSSKVARLIDEYELGASYGDRLEARWTDDSDERMSLRDLADLFNERLLRAAIEEQGTATVDGEVENLYRLLTDDDVSRGVRTEAQARLEREGVDVDRLDRDFVTYQAVRSYLTDYRGAEYDQPSDAARREKTVETIERLQSRVRSVVTRNLQQLRDTDRISLGQFRLFVDVDVLCEDCGAEYGARELVERGGCDCDPDGAES
jgi:predicted transcriptional regulator